MTNKILLEKNNLTWDKYTDEDLKKYSNLKDI